MSFIGSGQLRLNHRFCDNILDTVWHRRLCGVPRYQGQESTESFLPGSRWVTGAERFDSDAKDYDITGAMFVNNDDNDLIIAVFTAGSCFDY